MLLIYRICCYIILLFLQKHCPPSITFSFMLDSPTSRLSWFSASLSGNSFFLNFSNFSSLAAYTLASLTSLFALQCHLLALLAGASLPRTHTPILATSLSNYVTFKLVLNLNAIFSEKHFLRFRSSHFLLSTRWL